MDPETMKAMWRKFVMEVAPVLPDDSDELLDKCYEGLVKIVAPPKTPSVWKDYILFPGFEATTGQYSYDNFVPRDGDVLVASYAKTGTTWTTEIIRQLLYKDDPELVKKSRGFNQLYNYLEFGPVCKYEAVKAAKLDRRCFGTHLPSNLVNLKRFKKVIYVIRNPKDQLVSWYNFVKNNPYNLLPKDEREFYDVHIAGKQGVFGKPGEGYLEHVKDWYHHKNDANVMFLVFEDMKQDPAGNIKQLAEFVDVAVTSEQIKEIVNNTSFKTMKKDAKDRQIETDDKMTLFRKGQVGDWKNHLTVAQSEEVDRKVEKILGDTDITFTYELHS